MKKMNKIILDRREQLGLTQQEVVGLIKERFKIEISYQALGKYERGGSKTFRHLIQVLTVLGLNNKGEVISNFDSNAYLVDMENRIPLISRIVAGKFCESPDTFEPGDAEEWYPRPSNAGPKTFALKVWNDSMVSPYPGQRSYPEGTIIYIDPDKNVTNKCRVAAMTPGIGPNPDYTFKEYVEDAGRRYLKPINPTYEKIEITEDVHICGVVIGSYLPE